MKTNILKSNIVKPGPRLLALAVAGAMLAPGGQAWPQSGPSLPVYEVTQTGATPPQATNFALALGISPDALTLSNGMIYYLQPSNYLAVPTAAVTDQNAISNLLADTVNQDPTRSIRFEQFDYEALSNLQVMPDAAALTLMSNALASSGLTPDFGTPSTRHTTLSIYPTATPGQPSQPAFSQALDTQVEYHFTDPSGIPIVGAGEQIQAAFSHGVTTRLLYEVRRLNPGVVVQLIPEALALSRVASYFPAGAQVSDDIEYICPPLPWPWLHGPWPCGGCPPPNWNVQTILPYYVFRASVPQVNPVDGSTVTADSLIQAIPATDDPRFVPSVVLAASNTVDGVTAGVNVTGGAAPYTFIWSGSSGDAATNNQSVFNYHPVVRVIPPQIAITGAATPGSIIINWNHPTPDPGPYYTLETASSLAPDQWSPIAGVPVETNRVNYSVTMPVGAQAQFFRLSMMNRTLPTTETVNVTVIDANGVSVQATQTIPAQAIPVQLAPLHAYGFPGSWGTESPYDPGLGSQDRTDWRTEMMVNKAGTERFLWTSNSAWVGDYVDSPNGPGTLPLNPQVNGDADFLNWGVNSADVTLYIGHGNPVCYTFSVTPPLFYNSANALEVLGTDASPGYDPALWSCLLSCEVLSNNYAGLTAVDRWSWHFNGLHMLLGFETPAWAGTHFPATFADNLLASNPLCFGAAWMDAANARGTGLVAMMGPIDPGGATDINDCHWGKGPVGPTIKINQITGFWYLNQ